MITLLVLIEPLLDYIANLFYDTILNSNRIIIVVSHLDNIDYKFRFKKLF